MKYYEVFGTSTVAGNSAILAVRQEPPPPGFGVNLAKEYNVAVVVVLQEIQGAYHIRFYSLSGEFGFCGHGLLCAAAYLLQNTDSYHVTTSGGIEVKFTKSGQIYFYSVSPSPKSYVNINCAELSQVFSGTVSLRNAVCLDAGSPKCLIPIPDQDLLYKVAPNQELLKTWSEKNMINGIYLFCESNDTDNTIYTRSFNPLSGNYEDKATGVAAAALINSLYPKYNYIHVRQGPVRGALLRNCCENQCYV